jgi:hypothetical protein
MRYSSYSFITLALDGGEWSVSHPGRTLDLGKGPPVHIGKETDTDWATISEKRLRNLRKFGTSVALTWKYLVASDLETTSYPSHDNKIAFVSCLLPSWPRSILRTPCCTVSRKLKFRNLPLISHCSFSHLCCKSIQEICLQSWHSYWDFSENFQNLEIVFPLCCVAQGGSETDSLSNW